MKFRTKLYQPEGRSVTGIIVPPDVVEGLGAGKKPLVVVTINGAYIYRSAIANMGGQYMISVSAENRAAARINGGDEIDVDLAVDTAPRTVTLPDDFAAALDEARLRPAFDKLAPGHQKEHMRSIEEAKSAETRARRIEKAVAMISAKA